MEYQPLPERGETEEPPFYNCSECFAPIKILSLDDKNIKFKCYNNENNPHDKEISIKEYINKMKPNIKINICFIDNHNKKFEYYCIDCKAHLCDECLKQRDHINHNKIILKEILPNENELKIVERIMEGYKDKNQDLKYLCELIYNTYKNFSNNYYFMININKILADYINNNPEYKNKLSDIEYNNIIKIENRNDIELEKNYELKEVLIDYKNKIDDLKKQIIDIQKEKENKDKKIINLTNQFINKDKPIYELQKQISEQNIILDKIKQANIDSQSIMNRIIEQNEKEINDLKESNFMFL